MSDEPTPRRIGRPPGTGKGETPIRHIRVGILWDEGKAIAANAGETMTELVTTALRRELALRELAAANGTTVAEIMTRLTAVPWMLPTPDPCAAGHRLRDRGAGAESVCQDCGVVL